MAWFFSETTIILSEYTYSFFFKQMKYFKITAI